MRQKNDGSATRRSRLRQIRKAVETQIENNGGMMSLKKMLAWIDWENGLRPKKTMEYLETLKTLDIIDYDVESDFLTGPQEASS